MSKEKCDIHPLKKKSDYLYYEEVYNYIGFQTNW